MQYIDRKVIAVALMVAGLQLAACQKQVGHSKIEPAQVEHIEGSEVSRVTLTEKAIERIDLQTAAVREEQVAGNEGSMVMRKVVPYSALIYDPNGKTWSTSAPNLECSSAIPWRSNASWATKRFCLRAPRRIWRSRRWAPPNFTERNQVSVTRGFGTPPTG
jgi:hypothetical protein